MQYIRFSEAKLRESLQDTPVVLIHGSRQCGKTTLARAVGADLGFHYISFDDENQLRGSQNRPRGIPFKACRKRSFWTKSSAVEVDIIIERGRQLADIEIKASATITQSDFKGLKKLKEASGEQFAAGVVFYDGENILPFGERLFAIPISMLIPQFSGIARNTFV